MGTGGKTGNCSLIEGPVDVLSGTDRCVRGENEDWWCENT